MKTIVEPSFPEPRSSAERWAWALSVIRRPVNTPEEYRIRYILNDLLNQVQEAKR